MNLMLDTHVLLWWLDDSPLLSEQGRAAIAEVNNLVVVSAAAVWEIRIKQALGKLRIPPQFFQALHQQGFEMLPITVPHAYAVGDLPAHHRDPFDRMLIAQAIVEGFTILTTDKIYGRYPVSILEA